MAMRRRQRSAARERDGRTRCSPTLGQSAHARASFWNPVALATLNEAPERAAAAPFVEVLARAFFRLAGRFAVRAAAGRPRRSLHRRRPALRRAARRARVDPRARRRRSTSRDGRGARRRAARRPPARRRRLHRRRAARGARRTCCRRRCAAPRAVRARSTRLETSPIVSTHLWFDRPVLRGDFVGLLGTTTQWAFNRSRLLGESGARPVRERGHQRRARRRRAGTASASTADRAGGPARAVLPAARPARLVRMPSW